MTSLVRGIYNGFTKGQHLNNFPFDRLTNLLIKKWCRCLDWCASVVWVLSHNLKGRRCDFQ